MRMIKLDLEDSTLIIKAEGSGIMIIDRFDTDGEQIAHRTAKSIDEAVEIITEFRDRHIRGALALKNYLEKQKNALVTSR